MAVINLISASKWGVFVVGVYIGVYANQNYKIPDIRSTVKRKMEDIGKPKD